MNSRYPKEWVKGFVRLNALRLFVSQLGKCSVPIVPHIYKLLVFMSTLVVLQGCITPEFSSLDRYSDASGVQKFTYYVCLSSSARAEGRVKQAYMMDIEGWKILKQYGLKQPMVIQMFQQARHQGEKYTYAMAEKSCRRWSLNLPANS